MRNLFSFIAMVVILIGLDASAQEATDQYYLDQEEKRQEKLNFEGGVVEGLDKSRQGLGTVTSKEKARGFTGKAG